MTMGASLRPIEGVVPRLTFTRSSARAAAPAGAAGGVRSSSFLIWRSSSRIASPCVFVIGSSAAHDETTATPASTSVSASAVTNTLRIDLLLWCCGRRTSSCHEGGAGGWQKPPACSTATRLLRDEGEGTRRYQGGIRRGKSQPRCGKQRRHVDLDQARAR